MVTSFQSSPSSCSHSAKVMATSAMPRAGRESVPEKMTSDISPPRRALADCSPSTQRMASRTFDLPQPFGPTTQVTPRWKVRVVFGAKDLKPKSSRDLRYIGGSDGKGGSGRRRPQAQYVVVCGFVGRYMRPAGRWPH